MTAITGWQPRSSPRMPAGRCAPRHPRRHGDGELLWRGYHHARWRLQAVGFGERDNGIHAHDQYCEIKTIWVDLWTSSRKGVDG